MKRLLTFLCAGALAVMGCSRVDDLETKVDDLDNRVTSLETLVQTLNSQVESIDALVNTIKNGGYIQSVDSVSKDGINYYTLVLSNGKKYSVHDGATGVAGADGHTPAVGVKLDESDNNYYWTIDGEYTDPKVRVNGTDGKTPEISIVSGWWCIKWPGDENWTTLTEARGKDGDSFFKGVKVGGDEVTFTLSSGESFTVSLLGGFRLICKSTVVGVSANGTAKVKYAVKGAKEGEDVIVYVKYASAGWTAAIDEADTVVSVNVPADPNGGLVIVEAINNTTSMVADQAIKFEKGVLSLPTLTYSLTDASGILELPLSTNMEYQVTSDAEWLTLVETKAAHTEKLRFSYALNTGADARTANIKITGAAGDVIDVTVLQAGCPPLKASYEIGEYYERQGVIGIVWHFDENYVKVLALDEKAGVEFAGNSFANSWADSKTDGLANMNAILNNQYSSVSYFPAQKWCNDKGAGWYLPAVDEMTEILNNIDKLNTAISDHNGTKLTKGYNYWTSTQNTETRNAWSAAWDWDHEGVVTSERSSTLTGNARASYNVSLKATTTGPDKPVESAYKIGDEMKVDNGHGVVAYIDATGEHGYIISKLECEAVKWATTGAYSNIWPTSTTDGKANCDHLSIKNENIGSCPAANWAVRDCGNAGWFLPADEQLKAVLANFTAINEGLAKIGGTPLTEGRGYWSSTTWFSSDDGAYARFFTYKNGAVDKDSELINYKDHNARAIHVF